METILIKNSVTRAFDESATIPRVRTGVYQMQVLSFIDNYSRIFKTTAAKKNKTIFLKFSTCQDFRRFSNIFQIIPSNYEHEKINQFFSM